MNQIEFVPCKEGVTVVITKPNGEVSLDAMSWEQFLELQKEIEND